MGLQVRGGSIALWSGRGAPPSDFAFHYRGTATRTQLTHSRHSAAVSVGCFFFSLPPDMAACDAITSNHHRAYWWPSSTAVPLSIRLRY